MTERSDPSPAVPVYYPTLDGLRFIAFLLVFISHSKPAPDGLIAVVAEYGWVGVEVFFVISSFLFFRLLSAENAFRGRISVGRFYARRLLRLYPLMVGWPLLCLLLFGPAASDWEGRLLGIATFSDNVITWFKGYNYSVPFAPHLWTLSFEFQLYAIIPFVFVFSRRVSTRTFLLALGAIWLASFSARAVATLIEVGDLVIWVTPFLRMESVLIGFVIAAVSLPSRSAWLGVAMALVGAAFVFTGPDPEQTTWGAVFIYPAAALLSGGLLLVALHGRGVGRFLSWRPIRFLGKISFGLYVFHWFAQEAVNDNLVAVLGVSPDSPLIGDYALKAGLGFVVTVVLATLSYYLFEIWFLLAKDRLTVIKNRPV